MDEIYSRQTSIENIKNFTYAAVIGVGGVGSWVALNLALVGAKKLLLVDPDIVETSNLNRTTFRMSDIGKPKVEAISSIIWERRQSIELYPFKQKIEEIDLPEFDEIEIVFDCRDSSSPLPKNLSKKVKITGGYDGNSITFHVNPSPLYNTIFGNEPTRYTITPSWLIPPQLIANIIVCYCQLQVLGEEKIIITTTEEILTKILSLNS